MPEDRATPPIDEKTRTERLGALPKAPMPMPRQVLEHKAGRLARFRAFLAYWLLAHLSEH
ncbi:hypothetical protein [Solirhodobacter olei]|uniref:hypothetical protein n=1 Tax=Solirhodobacter olei TaxID=2493082 RepID=UPI000FD93D83|nr:hypothetical protein [Solirhodobacter olei]